MTRFRGFATVVQIVTEASNIIGGLNNTVNFFSSHKVTTVLVLERKDCFALAQKPEIFYIR
jgi:hypothetical protein